MNGMKTLEKYFKVKEIMETVKADKIDVDRSASWLTIEGKRNENNTIEEIKIGFGNIAPITREYLLKVLLNSESQYRLLDMAWNIAYHEFLKAKEEAKKEIKGILTE
jgi:hypothetical protein